ILWPLGERMDGGDDDGSSGDSEEDDGQSTPGLVGQQRPCTMGLSFATESSSQRHVVDVEISFGTYFPEDVSGYDGKRAVKWSRRPFSHANSALELPRNSAHAISIAPPGLEADVR